MTEILSQARVLVVEDEMLIALDIGEAIEAAEGTVVGPARSVAEAFRALEDDGVDAAILDRTLLDGKATPIAVFLMERAIPFIFYSGSNPDHLAAEFPASQRSRNPRPWNTSSKRWPN